jgi:hypothetical protein
MALDLNLIITADASQATRALASVESGIKKVEGAAKSTSDPINKVTTSVEKLAKAEVNLNDIAANGLPVWYNQQKAKTEALIASDKLAIKEEALMGRMAGLTTATGLSSTALMGLVGATGAAVIGATAFGAVLVKSTSHYFQHAEATRDSRDALAELGKGWESFQMLVGGAVLGQGFSIVKPVDALNVALTYTGALIALRIEQARSLLNTLQLVAGALPGGAMLQGLMAMGDSALSQNGGVVNPPMHWRDPVTGMTQEQLRAERDIALAAERRRAAERAGQRPRSPLAGGPGWMFAPTTLPGSQVGIPYAPWWPGAIDGFRGPLPGTPVLDNGPGFVNGFGGGFLGGGYNGYLPGATNVRFGGGGGGGGFLGGFGGAANFGAGISNTILQAITGGGSMVGGVGSYIGGGIGGSIAKALTSGGGLAIGGMAGGALNAILPGIGSLLGPALGWLGDKMFGPTDYELRKRQEGQDRTSANAMLNQPGLRGQWDMLGGNMPFSFDFLKTQAQHDPTRVSGYLDEMIAKTDRLTSAMERYGITWEELGDQAQQSQIDAMAKTLIEDFEILTLAGADVTMVIEKMGGSVQTFIDAALRTGSEVPAGMQPMIEKMIEMGLLTDENGQAFTSLEDTGLTFAKTMTEGFDSIVTAIGHLAKALGYDIPEAIDKIPKEVEIDINYTERGKPGSGPGSGDNNPGGSSTDDSGNQTQYHSGGYVWPRFHRGGEVPAILQAGEFVMSKSAVNRIGAGNLARLNRGGAGGNVSVFISGSYIDSERSARMVAEKVAKVYLRG